MQRSISALIGSLLLVPTLLADASVLLGRDVRPSAERLALTIDPDKPLYEGVATIEVNVVRPTTSFDLHLQDLEPGAISLRRGRQEIKPVRFERGASSRLIIHAPRPLAAGSYTLRIPFHGKLGTRNVGFFRVIKNDRAYVFSQFEPADARKAFPCWDEPEFKIPFEIQVTVPKGIEAVSNTPIESTTARGNQNTIRFQRSRPLPSYLVALAVGPVEFVPVTGTSIPTRIVTLKGQRGLATVAAERVAPILAAEEKYFGSSYPYEKLDLIAIPEYWIGAMENAGAITFVDTLLLIDPKAVTVAQRTAFDSVFAHELAHQWFGDLVTMAWWDDLWLNESFASWMASKIVKQLHPEVGSEEAAAQATEYAKRIDARLTTHAVRREVRDPDHVFNEGGITYTKGEAVLGMFENFLGPEIFRRGVIDYLNEHKFGSATANDLWKALSRVSGRDVAGPMSTFISQPGVPLIAIEPSGDGLRLSQTRFTNANTTPPAETWMVPVTLKYALSASAETKSLLLTSPMVVPFDAAKLAWLEPNSDARGYYRWSLPPAMLDALATNASALNVRERIELLGNSTALLDAGKIHGDTYLGLLARFANDSAPNVISALVDGIFKVHEAFITPPLSDSFAAYVRKTLGPAAERFGLEPKQDEDPRVTLFRPSMIRWLADFGKETAVIAFAKKKTADYLRDPSTVDASIVPVVLRIAVEDGDQAMFDEFRKRFEAEKVPRMRRAWLTALGNFRDPKLREQALTYALSGPVSANEMLAIPFTGEVTEEAMKSRFDWITSHWAELTKRMPTNVQSAMVFIGDGCDRGRLDATRKFFSDPAHAVENAQEELGKVTESVNDCIALRTREQPGVASYLDALAHAAPR